MRKSIEDAEGSEAMHLRAKHKEILKVMMASMKDNYQELGHGSNVRGAYVDFVHRVVELLQQHTSSVCPIDRFFTDSSSFPLPAHDPSYVVGQLMNYGLRLQDHRTPKQLAMFVQSVSERAAVDGQQIYLVDQLLTAMGGNGGRGVLESSGLRSFLIRVIFPAYVDIALGTAHGWIIAIPILQATQKVFSSIMTSVNGANETSVISNFSMVASFHGCLRHSIDLLVDHPGYMKQPKTLKTIAAYFAAITAVLPALDYMCRRSSTLCQADALIDSFESFALFAAKSLLSHTDIDAPIMDAIDTLGSTAGQHEDIKAFAVHELRETLSRNWICHDELYYVNRGQTRREIVVDIGSFEEERAGAIRELEKFLNVLGRMTVLGRVVARTDPDSACIAAAMVDCPICGKSVKESKINLHIDSACELHVDTQSSSQAHESPEVSSFFKKTPSKTASPSAQGNERPRRSDASQTKPNNEPPSNSSNSAGSKRHAVKETSPTVDPEQDGSAYLDPPAKRLKSSTAAQRAAPLAERMRPRTLDDVYGQELVGPDGVLRGLIETDRVPSMILWGGSGTGKTTIARVIATMVGSRFVEINSTSSGVGDCKKIFGEAGNELRLTGRKTIIFCDEIHRFSKSQQDVFLGPVESGQVTLIGATTENPSFKVQNALLSRCRTFTLQKLTDIHVNTILQRALYVEGPNYSPTPLVDGELIQYLSAFADGDARTGLNLLELAMDVSKRPNATKESIKSALTKTLVYDRAGDQHYDTISALHKSIRGSDPHASLYYLSRMLTSGEDPLYIARRLVIIASEDVGLADNTLLPLATATYTACEKIGMPECRINLAHCVSALSLAKKSTRAYRGLNNASKVLKEPGMAGLPIPMHLRNAPTRLLKEIGAGKEYKYNPAYRDGRVRQEYLPERLRGSVFLEEEDLGMEVDEDLDGFEDGTGGNS
ncbi:MAG: hypothetical protein Q9226_008111 [Calogaya cf. arnoldii]